jgi:hypothetical protein
MEQKSNDNLSVSQRSYVILKSISELKASLFGLVGIILILLVLMGIDVFTPGSPIFSPYVHSVFDDFKVWIPLTFIITSSGLIWYIIKGRQLDRDLNVWKEDYLEQAYILVFDTIIPKGDTTGEKILNLASAVFPELRSNYIPPSILDRIKLHFKRKLSKSKKMILSESMNYKVRSDYSVDLALRIPDGYFIVKDFKDKVVSFEDLKYLTKILSHKFKDLTDLPPRGVNIFRVICVAKNYNESFLNRETLEKLMAKDLNASFNIDLIVEERVGYSVLWTS